MHKSEITLLGELILRQIPQLIVALLIMTATYRDSDFGGRIIRLSGV